MIPWRPMLATPAPTPFDSPHHVFEVKWDGIRSLCRVDDGAAHYFSRTGRDITAQFPELQDIAHALACRSAVLDGEICVLERGVPNFHLVQRRNILTTPIAIRRASGAHPAIYMVFDVLTLDEREVLPEPWRERRALLEAAWRGDTRFAALSRALAGRGRDLYLACIERGLEGVVAKDVNSPYVPGKRTRHWLKVRREREIDCVVGGYVPRGALDFRSLAVGLYRAGPRATRRTAHKATAPDKLVYVGNVGTGFSEEVRGTLMRRLLPIRTAQSPFAATGNRTVPPGIQWVLPRLVARVAYLELTPGGHLRHPVFRGLRDDQSPRDCLWPGDQPAGDG